MKPFAEWSASFAHPPASHRPAPFMVWNGQVGEARITEMLEQYADRGVGGVFIHPRPGLVTEYLSDEWFGLWAFALEECERLGLECHIYDENGWPSGFAGGHVPSRNPQLVARTLTGAWLEHARGTGNEEIARWIEPPQPGIRPGFALVVRPAPARTNWAGFPYVDLLRPETTRLFLQTTHEEYAKRFPTSFGRLIKYVFADEPEIFSGDGLAYSEHIRAGFVRRCGYDVADHLEALCFGGEEAGPVRFDYQRTLHALLVESYLKPSHDWCEAHGLSFTGHFMEHQWPRPIHHPSTMGALRWMQVPGNDLLGFQFRPAALDENLPALLNLKELSSVANQLGRERTLVESCGGGGYEMALREFKPPEDFLMALGVSVINPHLSHQTIAGARKYDWPQTLSDHAAWWSEYRAHADHLARVTHALLQGRERNRILLLQPDTTAWLHHVPAAFARRQPEAAARIDAIARPHLDLVGRLYRDGFDFDLGDEMVIEEFAACREGEFAVGHATYRLILIPPWADNLAAPTLERLQALLVAGGKILSWGAPPARLDGRPHDGPRQLRDLHPEGWRVAPDEGEALRLLREMVPPRAEIRPQPGCDVLCVRRVENPQGAIWFAANPWTSGWHGTLSLPGDTALALDSGSGQIAPDQGAASREGRLEFKLDLPPGGHALYFVPSEGSLAMQPAPAPAAPLHDPVLLVPRAIGRLDPNVLVLDYCEVECAGRKRGPLATCLADTFAAKMHGFASPPWSGATQFRRTLIDTVFPPNSGCHVLYRFRVAKDLPDEIRAGMRVAIERPHLYHVALNGSRLYLASGQAWLDEEILSFHIGDLLRTGENLLELVARPYHPLCEIMPAYVLGDFALRSAPIGFELVAAPPPQLAPWKDHGMPFYAGWMRHEFAFQLEDEHQGWRVSLPAWEGSVARVWLDDVKVAQTTRPDEWVAGAGRLGPGPHQLVIDVAGCTRNLLGPHHAEGLPGRWTWAMAPDTPPPGDRYFSRATGLFAPPRFEVGRA